MKLRLDILEQMTEEDLLEQALSNLHRYKPEPVFSKNGVGYLSPTSTEDYAKDQVLSTARIQRALNKLEKNGKSSGQKKSLS